MDHQELHHDDHHELHDDDHEHLHELHHEDHHELHDADQVGGGLLLLVIVVSLGLVSRYRRKFLEGKASKDYEDYNVGKKNNLKKKQHQRCR